VAERRHWAVRKYGGNVIYGVAKAETDRMASDMAHQPRRRGVTVCRSTRALFAERGACGRRLRFEQLGEPGVHRPGGHGVGERRRSVAPQRVGPGGGRGSSPWPTYERELPSFHPLKWLPTN
jgi:hypothetical protein